MCHVNLLKSYYARDSSDVSDSVVQISRVGPPILALSVVSASGTSGSPEVPDAGSGGDVKATDDTVICGRLKNSDCLMNLDNLLNHLDEPRRFEVKSLITK